MKITTSIIHGKIIIMSHKYIGYTFIAFCLIGLLLAIPFLVRNEYENNNMICDVITYPTNDYLICYNNSINMANFAEYIVADFNYKINNSIVSIYPGDPDNVINQYHISNQNISKYIVQQEMWIVKNYLGKKVLKGAGINNDHNIIGMFWTLANSSYYLNFDTKLIEIKMPWFGNQI